MGRMLVVAEKGKGKENGDSKEKEMRGIDVMGVKICNGWLVWDIVGGKFG